jgi:hypothetical protein
MTAPEKALPLDDVFFDRIVDGSLSPTQLRDSIERLDREPGAWKRCTLAFLEAHAWSESLRSLGQTSGTPARDHSVYIDLAAVSTKPAHRRWLRSAVAAGIAAASFAVGWFSHGLPIPPARDPIIVQSMPAAVPDSTVPQPPRESQEGEDPSSSGTRAMPALASDPEGLGADPQNAAPFAPDLRQLVQTVARLRVGPANAPAVVPILAGPGVTEEWISRQPPPVSEHGQVVLQRQGYHVEQHRRLLTTILPDGRRVALPVDEVQIQYTGNEPL